MKKIFYLLFSFLIIFGCTDDEEEYEYTQDGHVTFWVEQDLMCGTITVSIDGINRTINEYYSSGSPDCGASGSANFTLSPGQYPFYASCNGLTWEGTVEVTPGGCYLMKLTASGPPPPPTGNGKATFWINQDLGGGPITVNVNGQTRTITSYYSGGVTNCNISGCANFDLPAGSYSYSASSSNLTWNGTINVTENGCSTMQLTGTPPSGDGKVTFWIAQDFGCGPITVNVNGQSHTITSFYPGGINSCGVSGCANFTLSPGIYNYTATCVDGYWSGIVEITPNGCLRMQFTI